MEKYCINVRAGIGDLQVVPIWSSMMKFDVHADAWEIRIDNEHVEESLTIELAGLAPARVDEFESFLQNACAPAHPVLTRIDV